MAKENLNGSTELLAKAMKRVFTEAVEETIDPAVDLIKEVKNEVVEVKGELTQVNTRLDGIDNRLDHHQKALDGIKVRQPTK